MPSTDLRAGEYKNDVCEAEMFLGSAGQVVVMFLRRNMRGGGAVGYGILSEEQYSETSFMLQ